MKYAAAFLCLFSLFNAFAQQTRTGPKNDETGGAPLLYVDGGGFLVDAPDGWILDREVGSRLGTCCVFYPKGSTWDNAETVMYPSIVTKGPGKPTLQKFMESDLGEFRNHDPGMSYEDVEDVPLTHKRIAKIRVFHNVNRGSSEAVAYIDEEKIIALLVVSSKTGKSLSEAMRLLRSALQTYTYMDVKVKDGANRKETPTTSKK